MKQATHFTFVCQFVNFRLSICPKKQKCLQRDHINIDAQIELDFCKCIIFVGINVSNVKSDEENAQLLLLHVEDSELS